MDYLEVKKCEVCGKTKHISEFSKSYPNRCKTCVAEHTRQMRAAEKLKAKVKATGEVIDVEPSGTMLVSCGSFINQGNYPIMQINDIADDNAMLEFAWIGTQYDVIKLAFLGRMKG
jgi:AhpD family alkylhydroperoxidase